jgi:flavorubredoxin
MGASLLSQLRNDSLNPEKAIPLFKGTDHEVYWVGVHTQGEEIECNAYLLVDSGEAYLIEPGGYDRFGPVRDKIEQVVPASAITHLLFSHQDPDVCASLPSWMEFNPALKVVVPSLWTRFLPHYMAYNVNYVPVADDGLTVKLKSGAELTCIPAPYLHSPGNMAVLDAASGLLFTGDIGASVYKDQKLRLVLEDWESYTHAAQGFHQRYMGSNRAVQGFLARLNGHQKIRAILPQHGVILRGDEVQRFTDWLRQLPCGVDYLYPAA